MVRTCSAAHKEREDSPCSFRLVVIGVYTVLQVTQVGDVSLISHRRLAMSGMDVPLDIFTAIEHEISSETSPVGIDAKKTHIIILHKLQEIDERLRRIEARLDE